MKLAALVISKMIEAGILTSVYEKKFLEPPQARKYYVSLARKQEPQAL